MGEPRQYSDAEAERYGQEKLKLLDQLVRESVIEPPAGDLRDLQLQVPRAGGRGTYDDKSLADIHLVDMHRMLDLAMRRRRAPVPKLPPPAPIEPAAAAPLRSDPEVTHPDVPMPLAPVATPIASVQQASSVSATPSGFPRSSPAVASAVLADRPASGSPLSRARVWIVVGLALFGALLVWWLSRR